MSVSPASFAVWRPTATYPLSLHDALPICAVTARRRDARGHVGAQTSRPGRSSGAFPRQERSEEHTSELQSRGHLVCRLLLAKTRIDRPPEYEIKSKITTERSKGSDQGAVK